MKTRFKNVLYLVFEGGELAGKTSAKVRLVKVLERAAPKLSVICSKRIRVRPFREPDGRGRKWIMSIFSLMSAARNEKLKPRALAEYFLWGRRDSFQDLTEELSDQELTILVADRCFLSQMAIQGEWSTEEEGVPLNELEEANEWATLGLFPDIVLYKFFPTDNFNERISFRQLMILLSGRETMAQDLADPKEFEKIQIRYAQLAERYTNSIHPHILDASEPPMIGLDKELVVVASAITKKFSVDLTEVLAVLRESARDLANERVFEVEDDIKRGQEFVEGLLVKRGLTAYDVMSQYRSDNPELYYICKELYNKWKNESTLPPQARK